VGVFNAAVIRHKETWFFCCAYPSLRKNPPGESRLPVYNPISDAARDKAVSRDAPGLD
jgi:hypothetical protein